ncbi:MAG: thrombospondin type 3 repeat-containing protein [Gammaproteobacteria bacterium]
MGPGNEINDSFDVEFTQGTIDAAGTVTEATNDTNCVGPWLTWDTYPGDPALDIFGPGGVPGTDGIADFIGDGATSHAITGSPTGTNFFRIEAFTNLAQTIPLNTLDPGDADGNGSTSSVETNLFTVVGKVYDGRLATPMIAERTTYSRDAAGTIRQVDVFTAGSGTALVSFTGGPNVGGPFGPLVGNLGDFFGSELLNPNAAVIPPVLDIDATDVATDPTHLVRPLVDLVSITRADFNISLGTLTVEASSSDTLVPPTLRLVNLDQTLSAGSVAVTQSATGAPLAPPGTVTVTSTAGGSATRLVEVISDDQDGDGVLDAVDNCPVTFNPGQEDSDVGGPDGVGDVCDNCTLVANADQRDTNGDGFGNVCDADFNNNGIVDPTDFTSIKAAIGTVNPDRDLNGNGIVDPTDFTFTKAHIGQAPGPSGLNP